MFFSLLLRFISKKGGKGELIGIMWLYHMMLSHEEGVIQTIFCVNFLMTRMFLFVYKYTGLQMKIPKNYDFMSIK